MPGLLLGGKIDLDGPGIGGPPDKERVDIAIQRRVNQFMTGSGAIGFEINLGMGVGRLYLKLLTRRHFIQQYLGFQDRQGAVEPLGVQVLVDHACFLGVRFSHVIIYAVVLTDSVLKSGLKPNHQRLSHDRRTVLDKGGMQLTIFIQQVIGAHEYVQCLLSCN